MKNTGDRQGALTQWSIALASVAYPDEAAEILDAYNELRRSMGLPKQDMKAAKAYATSGSAAVSASSRVTPSAAPASSTVAATTVPPPAVSSECALAALNLAEANDEDSARVEAMYAGAKKFADAKDLRSICNVERKVHPILQRVIVRTEQVLSIQATCPELGTEDLGGQAFLDETRSMVVRVARTIESCPPEQHHWQRVPVGGEVGTCSNDRRCLVIRRSGSGSSMTARQSISFMPLTAAVEDWP